MYFLDLEGSLLEGAMHPLLPALPESMEIIQVGTIVPPVTSQKSLEAFLELRH